MPVRRFRFILFASIAVPALLAAGTRPAFAQKQQPPSHQVVLNNIRGLDFGRFAAGSGGTIVLSPAGLRSRTGGVILLDSTTVGQAAFNVDRGKNGGAGKAVIIAPPPNGVAYLSSGANRMAVNNFVDTSTAPQLIPDGGLTLSLGATLSVAPDQAPGSYSGTFSLTVNYE